MRLGEGAYSYAGGSLIVVIHVYMQPLLCHAFAVVHSPIQNVSSVLVVWCTNREGARWILSHRDSCALFVSIPRYLSYFLLLITSSDRVLSAK